MSRTALRVANTARNAKSGACYATSRRWLCQRPSASTGAREHNSNLSLEIPRDQFVVITGERRWARARSRSICCSTKGNGVPRFNERVCAQFVVEQMARPDVDLITRHPAHGQH